jgi:hypothetical protein
MAWVLMVRVPASLEGIWFGLAEILVITMLPRVLSRGTASRRDRRQPSYDLSGRVAAPRPTRRHHDRSTAIIDLQVHGQNTANPNQMLS